MSDNKATPDYETMINSIVGNPEFTKIFMYLVEHRCPELRFEGTKEPPEDISMCNPFVPRSIRQEYVDICCAKLKFQDLKSKSLNWEITYSNDLHKYHVNCLEIILYRDTTKIETVLVEDAEDAIRLINRMGDRYMSYDVSFTAKLDGVNQYVPVGDSWINHGTVTANAIKEACGSYPSKWDGMKCSDLCPVLEQGIQMIKNDRDNCLFSDVYGDRDVVKSTVEFLSKILDNCRKYPTAYISVDY